ncbi:plant cysteine oxidase 4-like [Benincasa hispida]|uniref:plant cysteine oxidase 4-like n=1 Tax=Benincasa hispida TaxID=102211 RepID=UPI0018FF8DB7|nr:plant cysteine oxidase 4-like [Benincasa hispida]
MSTNKVQLLYNICNEIFCHKQLPTFQQLNCLKNHLDEIKAIDVGIEELEEAECSIISPRGLIYAKGVSEITYIHIHECDFFSIGIFCLPEGGELPLHDHPGMTVMSKLLYGSVHVKAYDWIKMQISSSTDRTFGLGKKVVDKVWSAPSEARALFPASGGNIHSFRAKSGCAILDVLSPPYSQHLGRPSTYFSDFPLPTLPDCAMLEEIKQPEDLYVVGAPYLGSSIVTKGDETYTYHQYF